MNNAIVTCEQAPGHSGGRVEEGRRPCNYASKIWISASKKVNAKCWLAEMILVMTLLPLHMFVNVCSHLHWLRKICQLCRREARVMMSLPKSSPPKSSSHWLFQCRYSNSTDIVASSPSFPRPATTLPRRACSWAKAITAHCKTRQTRFLYSYENTVLIYFYNINADFHCYAIKNINKNCADCLRNLPELFHCLVLLFFYYYYYFVGVWVSCLVTSILLLLSWVLWQDDYRTGCRNVSHCQQQQSYSGLHSP